MQHCIRSMLPGFAKYTHSLSSFLANIFKLAAFSSQPDAFSLAFTFSVALTSNFFSLRSSLRCSILGNSVALRFFHSLPQSVGALRSLSMSSRAFLNGNCAFFIFIGMLLPYSCSSIAPRIYVGVCVIVFYTSFCFMFKSYFSHEINRQKQCIRYSSEFGLSLPHGIFSDRFISSTSSSERLIFRHTSLLSFAPFLFVFYLIRILIMVFQICSSMSSR